MAKTLPRIPLSAVTPLKVVAPKVDFISGGSQADVTCTVSGLDSLAETLRQIPPVFRNAAGKEMSNIAHEIIEDARDNYVPFKTGALHDSGNADEWDGNQNSNIDVMQIGMWFGAPTSAGQGAQAAQTSFAASEGLTVGHPEDYALEQHENMEYHHHPPPDMSGPKYLERPFNAVVDTIAPRLAAAAAQALGIDDGARYNPGGGLSGNYVPRPTYKGTFARNFGFTQMTSGLPHRPLP